MIKLLTVADMAVPGVTMNRLYSLERLAENGHDIAVRMRHKFPTSWDVDWADCILYLRAINGEDLNFLKECKLKGKKIWVDTDDDLLNVPLDHNGYFSFQDAGLREAYKQIHFLADHVTFSTKVMAESGLTEDYSIIPCSYPDEVVERLTRPAKTVNTVIWRGTETHERSLDEFGPAIVEVMSLHPKWRIEFFGCKPWRILKHLNNAWYCHNFYPVPELLQKLHETRAAVHIVPRVDDAFTRARSSISYVEAAFAGAISVAPAWDEWMLPGTINYTNDFAEKFDQAIVMAEADEHRNLWQASVKFIKKNRTWSATNKQHAKILHKIMAS